MTVTKWMAIVRQCILRRVSVQQFGDLLQSLEVEIDGKRLFAALFDCRESFCAAGDPLISLYLDHVGTTGIVSVPDALLVLINKWNDTQATTSQDRLVCYSQTLQDITMIIVSSKNKATVLEARLSMLLTARWLSSMVRQASSEPDEPSSPIYHNVVESLAFLLASMAATDAGLEALSIGEGEDNTKKGAGNQLRATLRQALESCLPLYSSLSSQLMERINTVLKHISILDDSSSQTGNAAAPSSEIQALQFQVSIPDTQLVASKAATMIYLEASLFSGSTIDDGTAVNFLSSRYQNDYQSMFNDLLLTSFRIVWTQSRPLCQTQCQIFIQNKLPALLSMISASSFNSFSTEQAITDSWNQILPHLSNEDLLSTGGRFLHTCALHHLISLQNVASLTESTSTSKGLYAKDDLVAQVISNHARGPKLVDELVRIDGSVGSISQALVEIMHNYCQNKETQYLKDLANAILKRPTAINCIAMFIRPAVFLGPLCSLLDDWRWDEIHGEAQPVYDEFGAVFLLILVTRSRLGLSKSGLGIRKKDGFLAAYLDHENSEEALENLSEDRKTHLGNWINALYLAEGLNDELFTNCSPHEFYLLIPTLLRQSISAHQQEKLTLESLKAGLDYLLEPFLLPSLITALSWVGNLISDDRPSASKVLEILVKSPSSEIHQTILAMSASHLRIGINRGQPQDDSFASVLKILDQCPEFSLAPNPGSQKDVLGTLQNSIVNLVNSTTAEFDITALLGRAAELRGPEEALRALVGVLLQLSDSHNFLFALDTVSILVCMSEDGLRDALRLQYNNLGALLKGGDTLTAEAIVRLYRHVEAYMNLLTVQDMGLGGFTFAQSNIDTANPNLDGVPEVSGDGMAVLSQFDPLDQAEAMGHLDSNDGDMSFDALYGLQGSELDLNDLDLDMF